MRLSKNAKLYWDTNDSYDLPDWGEVAVQDLTLSESYEEANVTDRGSGGFTQVEPTLNGVELSFSMEASDNVEFTIFLFFYQARQKLVLKVVDSDDDDEDQTGIMGWFKFVSFGRDQNLADSQKVNIVAKPCSAPVDQPLVYLTMPAEEVSFELPEEED